MKRGVNQPRGRKGPKGKRGRFFRVVGAVAFVAALLYWEQAALLYVLSTLAVCGLLMVVAFSDLEGSGKGSADAAQQEKAIPAGVVAAPEGAAPDRSVARRDAVAAKRLKTTTRRTGRVNQEGVGLWITSQSSSR